MITRQKLAASGWLLLFISTLLPAADLTTVEAQYKTYPQQYHFDGVVEAVNRATVASRIAAEVTQINVDVNDRVEKDAVILRFNDAEIKARLQRAEANLLAEKAQYQEALARQKEALAEAGRVSDLFARKQVTRAALDKAEADKAAANARVNVLSAQVKAREAELEEARVAFSYTVIKAPYSGIVTRRLIEVGEMASPGQLLISGVSLEALRVVTPIPQRLLDDLLPANISSITTATGQSLRALDSTLVPQADSHTHAFDLRTQIDVGNRRIYPGTSVKVTLTGDKASRLVLPEACVVQRSEMSGVYVMQGESISFRQVRTGSQVEPGWIEILSGLTAGEQVIKDPSLAVSRQQQHD